MRWHTTRKRKEVLELYGSTMLSSRAVAERTGVNRQTVCDWVREAGLTRARNDSRGYPEHMRRKAIRIYLREEIGTPEVAARLGVSPTTVKRWVREAGVMRSRSVATSLGQTDRERVIRVGRLRAAGRSYREIAEMADIPMGSIHNVLQQYQRLF